jgi:hypothetical protein
MDASERGRIVIDRRYHPWWKWECYRAGFFRTGLPHRIKSDDAAKRLYSEFLANDELFEIGIDKVFREWPHSCEQFLTNPSINRVAWIGQSSMCSMTGIPACYRGGFRILSAEGQARANDVAERKLRQWVLANGGSIKN